MKLFSKGYLSDFLNSRKNSLINEIDNFSMDYLFNVSEHSLKEYLIDKYKLEPIALDENNISVEDKEVYMEVIRDNWSNAIIDYRAIDYVDVTRNLHYVKGLLIKMFVPFVGNKELFEYKASQYNIFSEEVKVEVNELVLAYKAYQPKPDVIKGYFSGLLERVKNNINNVTIDVEKYNERLDRSISEEIHRRKEKFKKDQDVVESLGFKIRKRSNVPSTFIVPEVKKKLVYKPQSQPDNKFRPEPVLSIDDYEYILNIISNMSKVMERSPNTFAKLKEEEIRDHFLIQLNGHFEGQATGETFNAQGKTDILIRHDGKNIFIAECKFWKGEKTLLDSIDQLLSYLTWRDTKTAILMFNKNKDLTSVLNKIPNTVKEHKNYKNQIKYDNETGFRFIFNLNNDIYRECYLTIIFFDIPIDNKKGDS